MAKGIPKRSMIRLSRSSLAFLLIALFVSGSILGAGTYYIFQSFGESQEVLSLEKSVEKSTNIVAVSSNGEGVLGKLTVDVAPGKGRVLVDTETLVGFDFQYADRVAVKVAANEAGIALDDDDVGVKNIDIHFLVSSETEEEVRIQAVDGPSAGATTAVLTYAALENKTVRDDVVMTGTIREDGSIGVIGGVAAKAMAAEEAGKNLLLVPEGQTVTVYEQLGFFTVQRTKPISYLQNYAAEQGWNLQIVEVSTIEDAIDLMIQ